MSDRNGENKKDILMKKRNSSLGNWLSENTPFSRQFLFGKVSLCAFFKRKKEKIKKAGLTIEAALVLPLFLMGCITLISFMDVYKVQTEHLSTLCEKAKEMGMYAYGTEENGTKEITLPDVYTYRPAGSVIPLPAVTMHNTIKVHTWTGERHQELETGDEKIVEKMVYVTESGSVYHRKLDCRYLRVNITHVAGTQIAYKRNEYGEKYHACESCSRNQKPGALVYITGTGNRYHNNENCSSLKRTVRLVKESEVKNMHVCSNCR